MQPDLQQAVREKQHSGKVAPAMEQTRGSAVTQRPHRCVPFLRHRASSPERSEVCPCPHTATSFAFNAAETKAAPHRPTPRGRNDAEESFSPGPRHNVRNHRNGKRARNIARKGGESGGPSSRPAESKRRSTRREWRDRHRRNRTTPPAEARRTSAQKVHSPPPSWARKHIPFPAERCGR